MYPIKRDIDNVRISTKERNETNAATASRLRRMVLFPVFPWKDSNLGVLESTPWGFLWGAASSATDERTSL